MPTGKIKFYNKEKGYGFILQDDGGQDIFLHNSAMIDKVMLEAGYDVEFDIERGKQGLEAKNVIVTNPDPNTLPPLVRKTAPAQQPEQVAGEQPDEDVDEAKEAPKVKQVKGQSKQLTRTQDQTDVRMSVAFMTKQVQTEYPLEFVFIDNETIKGELTGFDAYTLKVVSDANEKYLIQKHALKYIKKRRQETDDNEEKSSDEA